VKFSSREKLPDPLPFADVEFYPRESMKYHSKLDPQQLLRAAATELAESDPEAFKVLVLELGAGLRRGEIDRLLWRQVECAAGIIHVEITEVSGLKSADSTGQVHIDETLASALQGFKARASSEFVIEASHQGENYSTPPWARRYRCQSVFDRLIRWLRAHGVQGRGPLHTLRKEAGSIIATKAGIYAASRFLRHSDLQVTAMHYADHKERTVIDMSGLLLPKNAAELPAREKKSAS
jgi:integrase